MRLSVASGLWPEDWASQRTCRGIAPTLHHPKMSFFAVALLPSAFPLRQSSVADCSGGWRRRGAKAEAHFSYTGDFTLPAGKSLVRHYPYNLLRPDGENRK